jgi:hypothetical protein
LDLRASVIHFFFSIAGGGALLNGGRSNVSPLGLAVLCAEHDMVEELLMSSCPGVGLAVSPFQGFRSKFAICRPGPYGTRQWLFRPFGPEELSTSYAPAKCHVATLTK